MLFYIYQYYSCYYWYHNHDIESQKAWKSITNNINISEIDLYIPVDKEKTDGEIYIMVNPGFKQKWLKIGKTKRDTESRAAELSSATGIPTQFLVAHAESVMNVDDVEKIVHQKMSAYRVALNREFFEIDLKDAIKIIQDTALEVRKKV
jgi:hypothetical protein